MKKRLLWIIGLITFIIVVLILIIFYVSYSNNRLGPCDFKYSLNGKNFIGSYCNTTLYSDGLNWLK